MSAAHAPLESISRAHGPCVGPIRCNPAIVAHDHPSALIIDDNDDVREVLEYFVAVAGYTVTGARNGREALEKLRSIHPCIITLDLMMPDMTGVDFRHAQLADERLRDVPVVVYSAAFNGAKTAARIGAVAFVEKSQSVNDLLQVIRQYCLK